MARRGRGASRGRRKGAPAWMWLLTGILIGLGLAWYLFAKGYVSQPRGTRPTAAETAAPAAADSAEEVAPRGEEQKHTEYDFFTVLPEMEVVVPEQELAKQANPATAAAATGSGDGNYLLQVGSFRAVAEAEQRKARLALLGVVAKIQTVTVNETTWHRVRVGPVNSAREVDELRNRLAANGIDSLVLKGQ